MCIVGICRVFGLHVLLVYRVRTCYLWGPEEDITSPGTGVIYCCESQCGCWESNQAQSSGRTASVHITEPSLQPSMRQFTFSK